MGWLNNKIRFALLFEQNAKRAVAIVASTTNSDTLRVNSLLNQENNRHKYPHKNVNKYINKQNNLSSSYKVSLTAVTFGIFNSRSNVHSLTPRCSFVTFFVRFSIFAKTKIFRPPGS